MVQACKSNGPARDSGRRVSNTWVIYPRVGDNTSKEVLIPDNISGSHDLVIKGARKGAGWGGARGLSASWWGNGLPRRLTGSWSKRTVSHIGTEILPRLLREAAVEDL